MTEIFKPNIAREEAQFRYMEHFRKIAQHSAAMRIDMVTAQGSTIQQRLDWVKSLAEDFDAVGIGLDWMLNNQELYDQASRHNSPMSFIDMMHNNPAKADHVLSIIANYFTKTKQFMRNGNADVYDSYKLKHLLEDALLLQFGYNDPTLGAPQNNYVSNGDAKGAMLALGFSVTPPDLKNIDWSFNTSLAGWTTLQDELEKLRSGL